jgi:hypothetical protein
MFNLVLQWKEFNINCGDIEAWLRSNIATPFYGMSANSKLEIHFESEPSEQEKADIQAYWDGLTDQSAEAQSYESREDIEAATLAKKVSAKAKLAALGLTEDELKAILG